MVLADRALARIMRKAAAFSALVQRQNGIGAERAKAHGRNVKHAHGIRLRAATAAVAYGDTKIVRSYLGGCHGVVDPLVAFGGYIQLGAKRALVALALSALVHQRALGAREGCCLVIAFQKILPHFGANIFQQKPKVPNDGVVAQNSVAALAYITQAQQAEGSKHHKVQQAQLKSDHAK